MSESSKIYPHIFPEISDWPIYRLLSDRKNLVAEIESYTFDRLKILYGNELEDIIAKTIYLERIRVREEPWKVDEPDEPVFWKKLGQKLAKGSLNGNGTGQNGTLDEILRQILHRYAEEIVGTFKISTFQFARHFLSMFFNRLLNTAAGRNMKRIFGKEHKVYERLLTKGDIENIRHLATKGTLVVVPTHSSNLDSILIGYAMDTIVGLPSFSYGAGLNLYNTGYTAYFMNRLGAYRVDRRKKNPVYLETLKAMSSLSIEKGTNSIFFPGGTRSRSGALESKLKMGLMGTAVEAQRRIYEKGKDEKIIIVPLILSYHVVLEAKYLIEQHLRITGKEKYLKVKDAFYSFRKLLKFGWNFFSQPSEITLSFGKPMDVLGNFLDNDGNSLDLFGNQVDTREYFMLDGNITEDLQRESEYTIVLAERIVERYYKDNIVLSSHVVSFAVFNLLKYENPALDIFGLLRLPPDDYVFEIETVREIVLQLQARLLDMQKSGRIKLSNQILQPVNEIIKDGVRNLGIYHAEETLLYNKEGDIVSQDFDLLFFYHNRLTGYGLEKAIVLRDEPINKKEQIQGEAIIS